MLNYSDFCISKYHPLYAGINRTIKYQVKSLPVHSITLFPLTKISHLTISIATQDMLLNTFTSIGVTSVGFSDNATRRR